MHIHLTTVIHAPVNVVFDLSRNITLHKISQRNHNEEVVSGISSGCIKKEETVTWKAKHLWRTRFMQVKVTAMESPHFFRGEQLKGDFKSFSHEHHFKAIDNGTIMIDLVEYQLPHGLMGTIFNKLFFQHYLHQLIVRRNDIIRQYAESDKWKALLA